jgi:ribonuclease-3
LEAILGAIYLDGGFVAAQNAIESLFVQRLTTLPSATDLKDPKTRLQEALQARGLAIPVYLVESISGKAHDQVFRVSCTATALGLSAIGEGASRRAAEQTAAKLLLEQIAAGRSVQ